MTKALDRKKPTSTELRLGHVLRHQTPNSWAAMAMENIIELLNDHAHLEKKAATNSLDLVTRWPETRPSQAWVRAMTSIARDEIAHLQTVSRLLQRRGGALSRTHKNPYASDLRGLVRKGKSTLELIDILLVSALIEARSCERFYLLSQATSGDDELRKLYGGLHQSEAGHYEVFLKLAKTLEPDYDVDGRWSQYLDAEAEIIVRQPAGSRMHSGGY